MSTIERVRTSFSGLSALEAYIEERPASDAITAKEATLLAIAPTPHEWMDYRAFRESLKDEGFNDIEDVFATLRRLEDRHLLDVFRELSDATNMRCEIGGWMFYQQWTALRKQITHNNNAQDPVLRAIHESIRETGHANIWRNKEHTMGTQIKVSVA